MRRQRGDTIIEVMLAFTVFSLVVVSSIMLMNKGLATAQRSLELTLVRQQIDAQLTMLDNFKQNDPAGWKTLVTAGTTAATAVQPPALSTITSCPVATDSILSQSFFMAADSPTPTAVKPYAVSLTTYQQAKTFANVDTFAKTVMPPLAQPVSYGIWMTVVQAEGYATNHAYDIHVRACWYSAGDSVQRPSIIATVARVYDAN